MKRIHVGYNIPSQEDVYIERFYNDEGTAPVKTIITCPDGNWSYNMDFLSEDEFDVLADRDVHPDIKEDIYIDNLGDEVTSYFTFY